MQFGENINLLKYKMDEDSNMAYHAVKCHNNTTRRPDVKSEQDEIPTQHSESEDPNETVIVNNCLSDDECNSSNGSNSCSDNIVLKIESEEVEFQTQHLLNHQNDDGYPENENSDIVCSMGSSSCDINNPYPENRRKSLRSNLRTNFSEYNHDNEDTADLINSTLSDSDDDYDENKSKSKLSGVISSPSSSLSSSSNDSTYNVSKLKKQRVNKLNLATQVKVIAAYDRNLPYTTLSHMFNCNRQQIKNTIKNRRIILKTYKKNNRTNDDKSETSNDSEDDDADSETANDSDDQSHDLRRYGKLNLEERVQVIEGYDYKITVYKLSHMFDCHAYHIKRIIEDRDTILKDYAKSRERLSLATSSSLKPKESLSTQKTCNQNERSNNVKDRSAILKVYADSRKGLSSVTPSAFKSTDSPSYQEICDQMEISTHLRNKLTCDDARSLIKAYDRNIPKYVLSRLFNCSEKYIQKCLLKRDAIMEEYRKLHPEFSKNEMATLQPVTLLTQAQRVEVIKAYDHHKSHIKLGRLFNCSHLQIAAILRNREGIMAEYQKSLYTATKKANNLKQLNSDDIAARADNASFKKCKNLEISTYDDALIALKPLEDYAKLKSNVTAMNLVTQLEEHVQISVANPTNSTIPCTKLFKNVEIYNYSHALFALKPVEDYAKLKNNNKAIKLMSLLKEHLKKKISKNNSLKK